MFGKFGSGCAFGDIAATAKRIREDELSKVGGINWPRRATDVGEIRHDQHRDKNDI